MSVRDRLESCFFCKMTMKQTQGEWLFLSRPVFGFLDNCFCREAHLQSLFT